MAARTSGSTPEHDQAILDRVAALYGPDEPGENILVEARLRAARGTAVRPGRLAGRLALGTLALALVAGGLAIADRTGLFLPPTARIVERALAAAGSEVPSGTVVYERVLFENYGADGSLESTLTREVWRAADGPAARMVQRGSETEPGEQNSLWLDLEAVTGETTTGASDARVPLQVSYDASAGILNVADISPSRSAFQHAVLGDMCQECHQTHYSSGEFEALLSVTDCWDSQRPYLEQLLAEGQAEIVGRERIGETECYVFERVYAPSVARLYVSVDDYSVVRYEYEETGVPAGTSRRTQTLQVRELMPTASLPSTWFSALEVPNPPYRLVGSASPTALAAIFRGASTEDSAAPAYPVFWIGPAYETQLGNILKPGGEYDIQIKGEVTDVLSGGEAYLSYDTPYEQGEPSREATPAARAAESLGVRTLRWPTRPRTEGLKSHWERIAVEGRTVWVNQTTIYDPYRPDAADTWVPAGLAQIDFPEMETTVELSGFSRDPAELQRLVSALRPLNE